MRISVRLIKNLPAIALGPNRQHGFTLIEILIVVFIVGMMALGISMVATRDEVPQLMREEMSQLQQDIRQLQDLAMLHHQLFGISFIQKSWRPVVIKPDADFVTWGSHNQSSQDESDPDVLDFSSIGQLDESKKLPWKLTESLSVHQLNPKLEMVLILNNDAVELLDKDILMPQILLSAQGDVTPFEIVLRGRQSNQIKTFKVSPAGLIEEEESQNGSFF